MATLIHWLLITGILFCPIQCQIGGIEVSVRSEVAAGGFSDSVSTDACADHHDGCCLPTDANCQPNSLENPQQLPGSTSEQPTLSLFSFQIQFGLGQGCHCCPKTELNHPSDSDTQRFPLNQEPSVACECICEGAIQGESVQAPEFDDAFFSPAIEPIAFAINCEAYDGSNFSTKTHTSDHLLPHLQKDGRTIRNEIQSLTL